KLRRLLDGVGEPRRRADREGSGVKAAVEGGRGRQRAAEGNAAEPALWGLVGNTPLIPLPPSAALGRPLPPVFLKAEWLNPGGSTARTGRSGRHASSPRRTRSATGTRINTTIRPIRGRITSRPPRRSGARPAAGSLTSSPGWARPGL